MRRRTKPRWRISESGGAIFLLFLLGPLLCLGWLYLLIDLSLSWKTLIMFLSFGFLTLLLWTASIRPIVHNPSLLSFRSLSEALFALAVVFVFWGSFTLLTGYTPTKIYSRPVPRSYCIPYFWRAGAAAGLGCLSLLVNKYLQRKYWPNKALKRDAGKEPPRPLA